MTLGLVRVRINQWFTNQIRLKKPFPLEKKNPRLKFCLFMAKLSFSGKLLQVGSCICLRHIEKSKKFYVSNGNFGVHKEKSRS